MSWNEFVHELAKKHQDLEGLYSEIDLPDDEKTAQCSELFSNVLGLMSNHVFELQSYKDQLTEQVETCHNDIQNLTLWLGLEDSSLEQLSKKLEELSLYSKHRLLKEERESRFELYSQKLETVRGLHRQLQDLSFQLGSSFVNPGPYPEEGAHVTFDVIQTFTYNIEACQKEKERKIDEIKQYIVTIRHLWSELGWTPQDSFDRNVIEKDYGDGEGSYSPLEETVARLELKKTMLEDERKKRETHVQELRHEIQALWEKLRIDDEEQEKFFEEHLGLSLQTVNAHKKELERLHDLKRLKLEEFVAEERNKLHDLWDRLYYSVEQREAFAPMFTQDLTDEVLELHELEVARLAQEVSEIEPILATVERYQRMVEEVREFEASTRDSSRLLKPEPGLLLKEEKTRKRLKRDQPLLEQELQQLLLQYQEEKGRPFLVFGEEYIVTMKTHMAEAREGRDSERRRLEQRREQRRAGDLRYGSQNPKNPKATHHSFVRSISPPPDHTGAGGGGSTTAPQTPTHYRTYNAMASSPHPTTPSRSKAWLMSPRGRAHTLGGSSTPAVPQSPSSKVTQYLLQTPSGQMHKHLGGAGKMAGSRSESPAVHRTIGVPSTASPMRSLSVAAVEGEARGTGPMSGMASSTWTPTRSQSIISVASMDLNDASEYQPSTPTRTRTPRPAVLELMKGVAEEEEEEEEDLTTSGGKGGGRGKASATWAQLRSIGENGKRTLKRTAAALSSSGSRSPSPTRTHLRQPHHQQQSRGANPFFTSESAQRLEGGMVKGRGRLEEQDEDDVAMAEVQRSGSASSNDSSGGSSTGLQSKSRHGHQAQRQRFRGGRSKSQPIEVDKEAGEEDDGWETEEDDVSVVETSEDSKAKRRRQAPVSFATATGSSSRQENESRTTSSSSTTSADSRMDAMIIHD